MPRPVFRERVLTFAIAAAGAALFEAYGLPLPFVFGPMGACLLAALAGVPLRSFGQITVGARTILGVAIGASITPALFAALPAIAGSVALIPLFVALIGLAGVPFFHRVWKFDPVTAYYAAMPGGLQDMVIFGAEAGGNGRALSLVHATRVLFIITLAPILLAQLYDAHLTHPVGAPAADLPLRELALMIAAALAGWKGGERIGLFGASILGPMIVTAVLSLGGFIHARPPREAILAAQFFVGTGIGVYFVGVTLRELRRVVLAGATYVAVLALLAAAFGRAVAWLGLGRPMEAFLAFAPGGQAEMTVIAIASGADLGYVIAHHLTRIVIVISGAPVVAAYLNRRREPPH